MTDAYITRLIKIKNILVCFIQQENANQMMIDMWTHHLIGYIEALEDMQKGKK